jgi:hypothetical protein
VPFANVVESLSQYVKQYGQSRNAIIREAIKEWVIQHEVRKWPNEILSFKGVPNMTPFEKSRKDLLPPDENPLK